MRAMHSYGPPPMLVIFNTKTVVNGTVFTIYNGLSINKFKKIVTVPFKALSDLDILVYLFEK